MRTLARLELDRGVPPGALTAPGPREVDVEAERLAEFTV
jgi:hypothetical protein